MNQTRSSAGAPGKGVLLVEVVLSGGFHGIPIYPFVLGRLLDAGRHEELLGRCDTYQHLWNQQTSHV